MSNEIEHTSTFMHYIAEHWPFIAVTLTSLGGGLMWVKKKVINDVYATKKEMDSKFLERERHVNEQFSELTTVVNGHHNELKDLIISQLSKGDKNG